MGKRINFPDIINRFASLIEVPTNNVISRLAEFSSDRSVTPEEISTMAKLNELDLERVNARCFDLTRTIRALVEDKNLDTTSEAITEMFVHDINNSLNCSMSSSELLSNGEFWDREDAIGLYNRVFRSTHMLALIIGQLKMYGRAATPEGFTLTGTEFDFPWTVDRTMERFGAIGPEIVYKDNTGIVDVNGRPYSREQRVDSAIAFGDPEMTSFVVSNLVGNAVKYKHPDRDHVSVRIIYRVNGDKVEVSVEDNGRGIEREKMGKIFERGYRVPGTGVYGTGLGLSLVKTVVQSQGGSIEVESEYGAGSKFTFSVPVSHQQFLFGRPYPMQTANRRQPIYAENPDGPLLPEVRVLHEQRELFV